MQAHELASPYPTVRMDTSALDAVRLLTEEQRPGLIVVDDNDHPIAIMPASEVLRFVIPGYVQDDPALARVLDEAYADKMCDALAAKTVADLMPKDRIALPVVSPDDTVLEIAALMAATRSPLVAVLESDSKTGSLLGAISVTQLLTRLLPLP